MRRTTICGLAALLGLAGAGLVVSGSGLVSGATRSSAGCPRQPGLLAPTPSALWGLVTQVPCPASGQAVYNLRDDRGVAMAVLDPIADPRGGYLGVYHTLVQPWSAAGGIYEILLAHSQDLIHWHRLRVMDAQGAAMPTLRAIPGGAGFLLAYEKAAGPVGGHVVRVCFYPSRPALLKGRYADAVDLPLRYSPLNDGTPSFLSIRWGGTPSDSSIRLAFHYELAGGPHGGEDREASGVLSGFRRWVTQRDRRVDALLDAAGMRASHGDERQFTFAGAVWRVYEAAADRRGFAAWHVLLYPAAGRRMLPLAFQTAGGILAASFGNPVMAVLPGPRGGGRVLAMTMFVFSSGPAAREAGELLFYRRLPGG